MSDALRAANEQLLAKRREREINHAPDSGSSGWLGALRDGVSVAAEPDLDVPAEAAPIEQESCQTLRVYVSLSNAWLKSKTTTQARFWLLMRHIDHDGRGWLLLDDVREKLTNDESMLRVCGQKRFEQILEAGNGVYWHIDGNGRIRIVGAAALCMVFNVERLSGYNVALSISDLTNGIKQFNATLYGAFHASRGDDANPISRAIIRKMTGISERRQRDYDHIAGITRQRNFSIEEQRTADNIEEHVWKHGRARFDFIDHQGKQGESGITYNARRLPNSYESPQKIGTNGRKKKVNSQLSKTLVDHGVQEKDRTVEERLFFSNGREAGAAMKRSQDVIWTLSARSDWQLWQEWGFSC